MATKTELEVSREEIGKARRAMGAISHFRDHASQLVEFWRDVIERWKYPQGQARHGGRLWRKRMDEQITMELSDLCTYWPTMLRQLDEIDALHTEAHTEITKAMSKLDALDGRADMSTIADVQLAVRTARRAIQLAINVREYGNIDGEVEEEL
jgi:hypothetical protein